MRLPQPDLERFRQRLASLDALPQLCLLGLVSGLLAGLLMVAFRMLLQLGATLWLADGNPEAFEQLSPELRSLLPLLAVLLIGIWLWRQPSAGRRIGISHVIERLTLHQGRFPLRNWLTQWWVGLLSVLGGLSAGREGPAIHLGAAAASGLGASLRLPNNSLRVLTACGAAAGISASFNTPIAGVIFAMEVVMMEYTMLGFMPVILASFTAALVTQLVYGPQPAFSIPGMQLESLWNLPWIVVGALLVGILAALFVRIAHSTRPTIAPIWLRFCMAGLLTAGVAWWYPQVQGMGYDSLQLMLDHQLPLQILLVLALGKLLLTAITVACGVPVSIIGPILVIGGAIGALTALLAASLMPEQAASAAVFVTLGMAAMMGAVLQAPLAALMAILELTHSPSMIMPGMLAVVIAGLTARQLGCRGFFATGSLMEAREKPLIQVLSRLSVAAAMQRNFETTPRQIDRAQATALLASNPGWLLVERDNQQAPRIALQAAALSHWLTAHSDSQDETTSEPLIDLLELPGQRLELQSVDIQSTLAEAWQRLQAEDVDALYVEQAHPRRPARIVGLLTSADMERHY
ncbi:chloride channel protein [Halopseudomonas yangmingensis]|uniref:H+/Cl-antiporter ClcA n=1 Tax=Halopseudomonas yangmingensis TaxID=1720063 RepID=A0A1I4SRU7_9GAMM|nr:chloride channel protein [Halopseudomonas yangmingensis]SFM67097.1 H+/Cl-antiporter ClcA [Halopseudomonas yangmingensis]